MTENTKDGIGFAIGMTGIFVGSFLAHKIGDDLSGFTKILVQVCFVVGAWWLPMYAYWRLLHRRR